MGKRGRHKLFATYAYSFHTWITNKQCTRCTMAILRTLCQQHLAGDRWSQSNSQRFRQIPAILVHKGSVRNQEWCSIKDNNKFITIYQVWRRSNNDIIQLSQCIITLLWWIWFFLICTPVRWLLDLFIFYSIQGTILAPEKLTNPVFSIKQTKVWLVFFFTNCHCWPFNSNKKFTDSSGTSAMNIVGKEIWVQIQDILSVCSSDDNRVNSTLYFDFMRSVRACALPLSAVKRASIVLPLSNWRHHKFV